jgi:stage II sporulation protein D
MKITTVLLTLTLFSSLAAAQDFRIGVFGLFHPRHLMLRAMKGSALVGHIGGESFVLESSSGVNHANVRMNRGEIVCEVGTRVLRASQLIVTGRDNGPVDFSLAVPAKITRRYQGTLEVKLVSGILSPVVTMDLETAVGSVVAAESAPGTPAEALKALAVAARSYFAAGKGRHRNFDFCDTTHCQFLREAPATNSAFSEAVFATRCLVLAYQSRPFAPMYTRSCSGQTRRPADLGLPGVSYPYYSVDCKYCRQHPSRWQSRISAEDAATVRAFDESSRLRLDRRLGWSTVPSNNFVMRKEGERFVLQGVGQGHGIGLCQAGAKAMAEEGSTFREILAHYYPNAIVTSLANEPVH